jgi:STE24 endopeptidase
VTTLGSAAQPVDRSRAGGRVRERRARIVLLVLAALLAAALWAWCAHELWRSTVPANLHLPHVDVRRSFSASFLRSSSSFDRFLYIDSLLASVVLVAVLVVYARRGDRLMRESAAGRIGTGLLLGMLGYAVVWLAEVPFGLAAVWWERKHHISHQGYVSALAESFIALGAQFVFVSLALAIVMALAGRWRRWWWLTAAPLFAALALLSTLVSPFVIPNTHPLRDPAIAADARALATREGVGGTKVVVQDVSREVTAPNAEAVGFGPTRRVVLWDTLLDGRFSRAQVRVVVAHELGHIAHGHLLRRIGWLLLFLLPATALVAYATRRRGGLARPEAVPLALLVYVVLQLATLPLWTLVARHEETEADWSALQATRDPAAARALFEGLATSSRSDPDPPAWAYVLYGDHPTIAQRIAMTEAWQARSSGR